MNFALALSIGSKLVPIIAETITNLETLDQTPGKGSVKLQAALGIVKALYEATNPEVPFDSLVGAVTQIIAVLVDTYNKLGVFKKSVAIPA